MNPGKLLVLLLSVLVVSCNTDSVEKEKYPTLTIASDYLTQKDSQLFRKITDSLHCKLVIRKMNADQLIGEIRNNRFSSGIDLVMMESPYDVNRLNRLNIYQPLRSSDLRNRWKDYNVVPLAIDPFVSVKKPDSLMYINDSIQYRKTLFLADEEDLYVYLSFNYQNLDHISASGMIRDTKGQFTLEVMDLWKTNEIIAYNSQLKAVQRDSSYRHFNWIRTSRTERYNVYTIGILNQSEHYSDAIQFIRLLKQRDNLNSFVTSLNLEKIDVKKGSSKLILEDQIQYFTRIERILR